jgi:hypothetical protein
MNLMNRLKKIEGAVCMAGNTLQEQCERWHLSDEGMLHMQKKHEAAKEWLASMRRPIDPDRVKAAQATNDSLDEQVPVGIRGVTLPIETDLKLFSKYLEWRKKNAI